MDWIKEAPTEPGWYWVRGKMWTDEATSLEVVRVAQLHKPYSQVTYILGGGVVSPQSDWLWQRIPEPLIAAATGAPTDAAEA